MNTPQKKAPLLYTHDLIILGAGASGLMATMTASQRGLQCLLVDHAASSQDIAPKVRMAGGGMGNITNLSVSPSNYIGLEAASFTKRALQQTPPTWLLDRLHEWQIPVEERADQQIFCTVPAARLVEILAEICDKHGVETVFNQTITPESLTHPDSATFLLHTESRTYSAPQIFIALGSTAWTSSTAAGLQIAKQFGHTIVPPRPVLVPLIMRNDGPYTWPFKDLQGISLEVNITTKANTQHHGPLLFTHTGISGPAVLRASTKWNKHEPLVINWLPQSSILDLMHTPQHGKLTVLGLLKRHLPTRLAERLYTTLPEDAAHAPSTYIASLPKKIRQALAKHIHEYIVFPKETAGIQKAEAMAGGVATKDISSRTMESTVCKGLFILGECLDITGDLGGYNLHWAWASARAAGDAVQKYRVAGTAVQNKKRSAGDTVQKGTRAAGNAVQKRTRTAGNPLQK